MTDTLYTHPLTVALTDLDVREEASCATLFRYFEETAMRGSAHFGFDLEWYRARNQFWVIRTIQMERACAPRYLDELEISTWISSLARVRSDRNYLIRRARDGRVMARAIANWVYVDGKQMLPARIPNDIADMFDKHHAPALPPIGKVTLHREQSARFEFSSTRRAHFYEADSARHINNVVYVDWLEEGIRDALRAMGYPLALDGASALPWFYRHALEYARPALPGDALSIHTRLMRQGITSAQWEQEITHPTNGQLLRATSTSVWLDAQNHLVPWTRVPRTA